MMMKMPVKSQTADKQDKVSRVKIIPEHIQVQMSLA